jgi:DNA-binding response OmpR family regulator
MSSKILVVEDDTTTRVALAELLRQAGYDPVPVGTFHEARRALESETPDLLISDVRLDGFNGLQLVAINPRPLPAIIITAFPDQVLAEDARRLGADFLVKPFSPSTLLDLVARRLAGARLQSNEGHRRWTRKPLHQDVTAQIAEHPARLIDVSYGGIRFETDNQLVSAMPSPIRLVLPASAFSVDLDLIWSSRSDGTDRWLCGAAVSNDTDRAWRQLVDTIA